jgi:hypothetical protein
MNDLFSSYYMPNEVTLKETIEALDQRLLAAQDEVDKLKDKLAILRSKIPHEVWVDILVEAPYFGDWFDENGLAR